MDDLSVNNGLVKFQALWKKYYVKQKLLETRKEFEDIYFELEGSALNELAWPMDNKSLAVPKFDSGTQQLKSHDRRPVKLISEKLGFCEKTLEGVLQIQTFECKIESNDKCCQAEFAEKHATSSICSFGQDTGALSWAYELPVCDSDKLKDNDIGLSLEKGSDTQSQRPMQVSSQSMDGTPANVEVSTSTPSKTHQPHIAQSARFGKSKAQFSDFLTDSWLSGKSFMVTDDVPFHKPENKRSLTKLHEDLSLELLWIRQAIKSRKDYLKLKGSIR